MQTLLEEQGHLDAVGGSAYLENLNATAAATGTSTQAAETVRALAVLRRLKSAAQHIDALTDEADTTTAEALADTAQAEILAATAGRAGLHPSVSLNEVLENVLDEIELIGSKQEHQVCNGVPTGFRELDELTGGLHPGELVVIAGRPAMGTTTLAVDFLRSAVLTHRLPAVMFTRDASLNDIGMRLLAAEARVARHRMRSGHLTDDDWGRLARKMSTVAEAPLFLQDDANTTFTQLRAQCRRLHAQHDLQLACLDTVQMLDYGTRPLGSRYEEVSEIARRLKLLAMELQIPIVAVSTLNRGAEQRDDRTPRLSDLRDSGALEDVADLVLLIHREDAYDKLSPATAKQTSSSPNTTTAPPPPSPRPSKGTTHGSSTSPSSSQPLRDLKSRGRISRTVATQRSIGTRPVP
ncbi:replicative DNA helicase [Streptomyces sulphureus]|uniref:replicative DNA helicase n=1 Tax=Streptomyces sulphureus TaxID=47758 RepID=UPI0003A56910|nr:DnaB-like helicase C-terminal domain-containing protein [Streptomyces sulphureus]